MGKTIYTLVDQYYTPYDDCWCLWKIPMRINLTLIPNGFQTTNMLFSSVVCDWSRVSVSRQFSDIIGWWCRALDQCVVKFTELLGPLIVIHKCLFCFFGVVDFCLLQIRNNLSIHLVFWLMLTFAFRHSTFTWSWISCSQAV